MFDFSLKTAKNEGIPQVLTLYDEHDGRDTGVRLDPKKRLERLIDQGKTTRPTKASRVPRERNKPLGRNPRKPSEYDRYHELTLAFRDGETLALCAVRNRSLMLFLESL